MDSARPHWSELLKRLIETLAIVCGGLWVLFRYVIVERPETEGRAKPTVVVSVDSASRTKDQCWVTAEARIANSGRRALELKAVSIKLWLFSYPERSRPVTYLDRAWMGAGEPVWKDSLSNNTPLLRKIAPGDTAFHDFQLMLENKTGRGFLVRTAFYPATGAPPLIEERWGHVCT